MHDYPHNETVDPNYSARPQLPPAEALIERIRSIADRARWDHHRRDELIAQAVREDLPRADIAAAAGLSRSQVRRIAETIDPPQWYRLQSG